MSEKENQEKRAANLSVGLIFLNLLVLVGVGLALGLSWYKIKEGPQSIIYDSFKVTNKISIGSYWARESSEYYIKNFSRYSNAKDIQIFIVCGAFQVVGGILALATGISHFITRSPERASLSLYMNLFFAVANFLCQAVSFFTVFGITSAYKSMASYCEDYYCKSFAGSSDEMKWGPEIGFYGAVIAFVFSLISAILTFIRVRILLATLTLNNPVALSTYPQKQQQNYYAPGQAQPQQPYHPPLQQQPYRPPQQPQQPYNNMVIPSNLVAEEKAWYKFKPISSPVMGPNNSVSYITQHVLQQHDPSNPTRQPVLPTGPNNRLPDGVSIPHNIPVDPNLWYYFTTQNTPVMGPNNVPSHYIAQKVLTVFYQQKSPASETTTISVQQKPEENDNNSESSENPPPYTSNNNNSEEGSSSENEIKKNNNNKDIDSDNEHYENDDDIFEMMMNGGNNDEKQQSRNRGDDPKHFIKQILKEKKKFQQELEKKAGHTDIRSFISNKKSSVVSSTNVGNANSNNNSNTKTNIKIQLPQSPFHGNNLLPPQTISGFDIEEEEVEDEYDSDKHFNEMRKEKQARKEMVEKSKIENMIAKKSTSTTNINNYKDDKNKKETKVISNSTRKSTDTTKKKSNTTIDSKHKINNNNNNNNDDDDFIDKSSIYRNLKTSNLYDNSIQTSTTSYKDNNINNNKLFVSPTNSQESEINNHFSLFTEEEEVFPLSNHNKQDNKSNSKNNSNNNNNNRDSKNNVLVISSDSDEWCWSQTPSPSNVNLKSSQTSNLDDDIDNNNKTVNNYNNSNNNSNNFNIKGNFGFKTSDRRSSTYDNEIEEKMSKVQHYKDLIDSLQNQLHQSTLALRRELKDLDDLYALKEKEAEERDN
ncbi:hypothetical protein PPL_01828 [Heterostelium album PN500]|uniref:Uncharacterized protein n=1 Tax=Heterostelium pallidum (strain ATCC 26659 / Pp 5 / PN500) TaxID=670386 RepID=D3B0L1_HETP5|nr:hypothetical protein PPL_01828 [Heterostelium album PN500]EFA84835.1 hypothetical protein PPL_01828 [Heterostelium album PN500]|eukprot:XP_020436946.1 hypothetical protein PPL_01828 [Heterostelium album PN500]